MTNRRVLAVALLLGVLGTRGGGAPAYAEGEVPLKTLLSSGDPLRRIEGLGRVEAMPKGSEPEAFAVAALSDPDWGVVIRAAKALEKVGSVAARNALTKLAVEGEIAWVREAAYVAAVAIDKPGSNGRFFYAAQQAKDPEMKARAILAAGRSATGESIKKLRAFAKDDDVVVEAAGVRAMGWLGLEPASRDVVLEFLDAATTVRREERKRFHAYVAAIESLAAIDCPKAREVLVREAAEQPDEDDYVPNRVARALAGKEGAGALVAEALSKAKKPEDRRRLARLAGRMRAEPARAALETLHEAKEERVRSEAVKALGLLGGNASTTALLASLADPSPFVRIESVIALAATLPPEEFRERAAKAAEDETVEVRVQWVTSLYDSNDPGALAPLSKAFLDKHWRVASAAIAAAGAIGVAKDLPTFQPLRGSRSWQVRAAAYEAMGRLRAAKAMPFLLEGLSDKDPVVRGVCHANLQILSKQRLSADVKVWKQWLDKHLADLELIKRSRRTAEEITKEDEERARYVKEVERKKRGVEILQKARILVISGAWDHAERVLDHLRIPNTLLRAQEIKAAGLNPNQVVLVNCEGNVDDDGAARLQWFVNVGGYLMSTDWAITKAVNVCFPGYVGQFSGSTTGNDVVVVESAAPEHAFTKGIFDDVPALQWWLEIQAFPMTVNWPERVEILVDSRAMKQRYGSSPMAATFRYGLGKVQHSISHFYLQEEAMAKATKPRDRMIFAADHLGLSLEEIRTLAQQGLFDAQLNDDTMRKIAPDYSMFRLIVNVVAEKSRWVEDL